MGHILLISDDELINDVYSLNLELYVGISITIKSDFESAVSLLDQKPYIDFIVTLSSLKENDKAALSIFDYIKANIPKTPLIIIGVPEGVPEDEVTIIPFGQNVKRLIQAAAKILKVTAKEMAEKSVPDFYPIPIKLFFNIDIAICDVYWQSNEADNTYTKIWEKGDICEGTIGKYLDKQIHILYIPSGDRLSFINATTSAIHEKLQISDHLSSEKKVELIEQGVEVVAEQLMISEEITPAIINISKSCIEAVKGVLKSASHLGNLLESFMTNKTRYVYSHSIMATYIAYHIVDNISWGGQGHKEKISFVFFFHDLFLVPIYNKYPFLKYEEDILFDKRLTDKDKKYVMDHAKKASEVVQHYPRSPLGADAIVLQHHGMNNGIGFTMKYKDDISPLAKVVIISESFVEEMFRFMEEHPDQDIPKEKILATLLNKFSYQSYKKIIRTIQSMPM